RRFFFFQAEDGIRDRNVTGVQTCALPISHAHAAALAYISRASVVEETPSTYHALLAVGQQATYLHAFAKHGFSCGQQSGALRFAVVGTIAILFCRHVN